MQSHIDVEINGKSLRLPEDFSIDIEEQNPMFNDVEMFSYPVEIPLNGNRNVVQNVDDVNSEARPSDLEGKPVRILVDGFPFKSGYAVVQADETVEDSMSLNVDANKQSFSDLISDLKCSDINVKDKIVIGEKIGNVKVEANYNAHVKADIKKHKDFHKDLNGLVAKGTFDPQALGFSYPAVCVADPNGTKQKAAQEQPRSYPRNNTVNIPKVQTSYINVSAAYGETDNAGRPAYYANARVCYKHYALGDDGATSSSTVKIEDSKNQFEDIYPYWVLDADRPQSGICFYVLYFLDCLFYQLGVSFDKSALMAVGDLRHLVFFTTKCKYTTRIAEKYYPYNSSTKKYDTSEPYFKNITQINDWLSSRGCGGQLEIENPETKTVDEFTYYEKASDKTYHYKVGDDNCRSISISADYTSTPTVTADICEMLASGENFPSESVSTVLESLEAAFGIKFHYDYEQKKVTAYLLRDVFRKKDTDGENLLNGKILKMEPMTEKILGFRMKYSNESDSKEQQQNLKENKKDYDTDYDYIDYPQGSTIYNMSYKDILFQVSSNNMNTYIDKATGNAYRVKRDKDAKTANDFKPVLFEVGGYKGVELGDCSSMNEDYIEERTISFQPIIFNDINSYREKMMVSGGDTRTTTDGDRVGDFNSSVTPVLAAYVDEDMEHEFVTQKIRNVIGDYYINIYATEKLNLIESYNPDGTDDGNSPLQTYDWGTALALMRGGGADMTLQEYDFNYDHFGTGKWLTVAGAYSMSSDSIDNFGNDYDYNGKEDGVGNEERVSLKIRAFKEPDWAKKQGISLCDSDKIDPDTLAITRKIKSRGLFDSFISEYAHFVLNRKKFKVTALMTTAQLADISNHWKERWKIDGKIGYINNVSYNISASEGVNSIEIEFFCI